MTAIVSHRINSLYQVYGTRVLKRARRLLASDQAAEDAMQEVFVRLLSAHEQVLLHREPLAWLYRVTTNLCMNKLRDDRRRTKLVERNVARDAALASNAEVRAVVVDIMERVPRELQEIAIYYYADGMTCEEIASLVGVSRRTIGNRLAEFQTMATVAVGNA
jgi:RNA polymerase sigma-70 factor (ECF subfamily)